MKRKLDKHGYRLWPQDVSKMVWYYEEPKGLCVSVQPRDAAGNLLLAIPAFYIPWSKVASSVERHRKAKRKRRRVPQSYSKGEDAT